MQHIVEKLHSRRELLRKGAVAGVGVPLAGGLLSACGSNDDSSSGKPAGGAGSKDVKTGKDLHSYDAKNNDFWKSWELGAREACAALGMEYTEAISDYDPAKQRGFFENAKTQGVQTASIIATDEGGSASLIRTLTDNGILVVNFNSNAPWSTPYEVGDNYIQYVSSSNYRAAKAMATALFEKIGGRGNLVHLQGVLGLSHDTERTLGVDDALKEFPGVKLIARQPGKYNRVDGQKVFEDILTRHPDVDAVFCQNDDMAIGVYNALKQHGKKATIAGVDGVKEWLSLITRDEMAFGTWAFHPRYASALEVVRLFDALNGWRPELPERFMGYASVIVDTPEAAQKYQDVVFADRSPWDYKRMSRALHPRDWDMQLPTFPWKPEEFWAKRVGEKPNGYELPSVYQDAYDNGDFEKVALLYKQHNQTNPLDEVLAATTYGKYITS